VRVADAGVQHRHDDVAGRGQHVPRFRRVNVRVWRAAALTVIVQCPKRAVHVGRIIGGGSQLPQVVGFGIFDQAALPVLGDEVLNRSAFRQLKHLQTANGGKRADNLRSLR